MMGDVAEEADLPTVVEEAEAAVAEEAEEDVDDQITIITGTVARIHNSSTTTISLSNNNRQRHNNKVSLAMVQRTSLTEG